jgi:hypothetical protein
MKREEDGARAEEDGYKSHSCDHPKANSETGVDTD